MKMKGSIILKIFLILLCGALLVAFAGLILWDRQQQQEDSARLRQLIETDQSGTDQTSEKTDDGKEPSEDAEAKEDISDGIQFLFKNIYSLFSHSNFLFLDILFLNALLSLQNSLVL